MHKFDKIDLGFVVAFLISIALTLSFQSSSLVSAIGIAFLLTTVGAFIAYWGDIIGHHIGKKRLSHFNLRPRQTAVLWTIAAGGASALATFIILLGINASFRTAVLQGTRLAYQNSELSKRDALLKGQIVLARRTVETAQADETTAQARQRSAQAGEDAAVAAENSAQAAEQKSKTELAKTENALSAASRDLKNAVAEQDRLKQDNTAARSQVIAEQAQVATATNRVADEQNKLRGLMSSIAQAERIFNPQMKREQRNRLIYDNKQEVGRAVIQDDTTDKIVDELNQFLDRLSVQAEAQGAVKNTATGRAVKVATVEILNSAGLPNAPNKHPEFAEEKENLAVLADQIHSFGDPSVVVIASSIGNSFDKGTVIVQLHPYVNHLAIAKGTVVATTVISSANNQPEQIMESIQSLLVTKVRPFAIHQGVIPVQENARDTAQLGDVPLAEIVRTIEEVQATKGDALISAYVPADVYSADQLHLHLQVGPAATPTSYEGSH